MSWKTILTVRVTTYIANCYLIPALFSSMRMDDLAYLIKDTTNNLVFFILIYDLFHNWYAEKWFARTFQKPKYKVWVLCMLLISTIVGAILSSEFIKNSIFLSSTFIFLFISIELLVTNLCISRFKECKENINP